jgi:hypothetical protein
MVSAGTAACKASFGQHYVAPASRRTCKCESSQGAAPAVTRSSKQLEKGGLQARKFVQAVLKGGVQLRPRKEWAGVALVANKNSKRGMAEKGELGGAKVLVLSLWAFKEFLPWKCFARTKAKDIGGIPANLSPFQVGVSDLQ